MPWAARRRAIYILGIIIFFLIVLGGPAAYWYLTIPATCSDGILNQDETAVDRGGHCPFLDENALLPYATMWARSFRVRDGLYNAAAYIQNPNKEAGVRRARYRFGLYDTRNILIAERVGTTFILPGGITPVIESRIDTGNRTVSRTYFEITDSMAWERVVNAGLSIAVNNKNLTQVESTPRLSATVENRAVARIDNVSFAAVTFDTAGNAFTASMTHLDSLAPGVVSEIVFSWPDPFTARAAKVDIIPLVTPVLAPRGQ